MSYLVLQGENIIGFWPHLVFTFQINKSAFKKKIHLALEHLFISTKRSQKLHGKNTCRPIFLPKLLLNDNYWKSNSNINVFTCYTMYIYVHVPAAISMRSSI